MTFSHMSAGEVEVMCYLLSQTRRVSMGKALGPCQGKGLTLLEVAEMFAVEKDAREWIEKLRWPSGPRCPHRGSGNVQCNIQHHSQTHRCRECANKPMFTVRSGMVMQGTHLKYQDWAIGIYLYTTNINGISSMHLQRALGISQKAAWFLLHRLRTATEKEEEIDMPGWTLDQVRKAFMRPLD